CKNFTFKVLDLADDAGMAALFSTFKPEIVVNLAAQAGVRYSLQNPKAYVQSNVTGFLNVLEGCRHNGVRHLVFASSSSVYGANRKLPFSEKDNVDHPVSLYAATKKGGELMAHSYAHLYGIPCTGLRFFTVYGPWGRPDMAYFKFSNAIVAGKAIDVYNNGDMKRDFTYIDDIVESMERVLEFIPKSNPSYDAMNPDPSLSADPYRIYNIGAHSPENLMDLIQIVEEELGIEAKKNFLPMQPGDVYATYADTDSLEAAVGFRPKTSLREGMKKFMEWYKDYYSVGAGSAQQKSAAKV
ncbi:MAG: GDP-mannose 4,6-dehydratase, partial [Alphaproteobacteria bacterium]|nr:GDP-mannose 4,6-dehydratase [Alphaproteobacteria bacterium]